MGMLTAAGSLGRSALVVKEFTVNQEGPHYVHIVARRGGIINWLLTLCGINTTTILDIYEDRVLFEHGSLSGKLKSCMPLSAMSVASGGFFKPVICLFWAFVFFIAAFFTSGFALDLTIILAIASIVYYFIRRSLLIEIVSASSWGASICFKRSIIEGVNVDYDKAIQVVDILTMLVMRQTAKQ